MVWKMEDIWDLFTLLIDLSLIIDISYLLEIGVLKYGLMMLNHLLLILDIIKLISLMDVSLLQEWESFSSLEEMDGLMFGIYIIDKMN
jgi:hypothetical protein